MRKKWQHDRNKKTCLSKEREARTFLKVVEACNCNGPKFPTRGNKTSRSRSTQSSSKQRKVPDSSRAVHAQWAMETQRKHQRASLARFARSKNSQQPPWGLATLAALASLSATTTPKISKIQKITKNSVQQHWVRPTAPKRLPDPPKTIPKPSPDPPKTLPKHLPNASKF